LIDSLVLTANRVKRKLPWTIPVGWARHQNFAESCASFALTLLLGRWIFASRMVSRIDAHFARPEFYGFVPD